jgi:hypothetical protein
MFIKKVVGFTTTDVEVLKQLAKSLKYNDPPKIYFYQKTVRKQIENIYNCFSFKIGWRQW